MMYVEMRYLLFSNFILAISNVKRQKGILNLQILFNCTFPLEISARYVKVIDNL